MAMEENKRDSRTLAAVSIRTLTTYSLRDAMMLRRDDGTTFSSLNNQAKRPAG
jgi:hypothetical protein